MWQKEENWNIALRKAAHKNAMQHVQQPLANKDGVKEVEETSISGAVCAKYILANKLGGAELKMHKEKCINEYLYTQYLLFVSTRKILTLASMKEIVMKQHAIFA